MIIDRQADFRTLLMHHVTTHWPDATITAYDPSAAGHLPDEFSGAGNDVILLGSEHGDDRDGVEVLERFLRRPRFPPVIYFGTGDDADEATALGPDAFFLRDDINHDSFIGSVDEKLRGDDRVASTGTFLTGAARDDYHPVIRGYELLEELGSTEYSAVYLAVNEASQQEVVLKVLRQTPGGDDSPDAIDRFLNEYEVIAELRHPNIVRIFDFGVADDHAHIAMEYIAGGDLRSRIEGGMPITDAINCTRQIASAIAALHELGILHRDLKPGNIMLRNDGTVALIDFGLARGARLDSSSDNAEGEIFGTPYYMSPEQGHGNNVDERSDIYSLGIVFYEMLTGSVPFDAETAMGIIYKHANAPIPLLAPRLSQYQALLNMLLAKRPQDRVQRAVEIGQWL